MNAEEYFFRKFGNKITASDSWVIRFCEEYASQLHPSPKEISEEEIEDNAIKRFRFHKDITPSEKTSLKIGFSVGAKWAINRLSLPSSGSKTEAVDVLEWLTRKDSPFAVMYGGTPELDKDFRFATEKEDYTISEVIQLFLKDKQQ